MVFTHTKIFKTSFLGASYYVWLNQTIKTSKRKEWLEIYQLDHDATTVINIPITMKTVAMENRK